MNNKFCLFVCLFVFEWHGPHGPSAAIGGNSEYDVESVYENVNQMTPWRQMTLDKRCWKFLAAGCCAVLCCAVLCCVVVWCGVVWCGVMCCGVVWCGSMLVC